MSHRCFRVQIEIVLDVRHMSISNIFLSKCQYLIYQRHILIHLETFNYFIFSNYYQGRSVNVNFTVGSRVRVIASRKKT